VPKAAAALGPPNVVNDDGLRWSVVSGQSCYTLLIGADGEFVDRTRVDTIDADTEKFAACKEAAQRKAAMPALPAARKYDLTPRAQDILAQWRDGQFQQIFDAAHPDLRKAVGSPAGLAHLARLFDPVAGKLVKVGEPLEYPIADFTRYVKGPVRFEKGTLQFKLGFRIADGTPVLSDIGFTLPKELQQTPDPVGAEQLARKALDGLLTGTAAAVAAAADLELRVKLDGMPDLDPQLRELVRDLGRVESIKLADQHECAGNQCLRYELATAKGIASGTFALRFDVSRWEIDAFNLAKPDGQ
jgi:hypothetical protein